MFCNQCGSKNEENAKFCNSCGADLSAARAPQEKIDEPAEPNTPPISQIPPQQNFQQPAPKKKGKGCLIAFLVVIAMLTVSFVIAMKGAKLSDAERAELKETAVADEKTSEEKFRELDARSWEDFKIMFEAHENFEKARVDYDNYQLSQVDFYNYCKEVEEYFRGMSTSFGYHTNEEEKKYLGVFKTWALSNQIAAKDFMKYLDNGKTSDLASAQENVNRALTAMEMIISNRATLLAKAGYTTEEASEIMMEGYEELELE